MPQRWRRVVRSQGNRLTPRDSLLRFEGTRGCCGDRIRACCLPSPLSPSTCLLTIWHLKGQKSIEEAEAAEKEEEITFQQ